MPVWTMVSGSYRQPPLVDNATNLVRASQAFDNTSFWTPSETTITANDALAPDGTQTAERMVESVANSDHNIGQTGITIVGGSDYVSSLHVKSGSANRRIRISVSGGGSVLGGGFDPDTGAFTGAGQNFSGAKFITRDVVALPNGWYRISFAWRLVTSAPATFTIEMQDLGGPTYVGDGTSNLLIWGAQAELGNKPLTYRAT